MEILVLIAIIVALAADAVHAAMDDAREHREQRKLLEEARAFTDSEKDW